MHLFTHLNMCSDKCPVPLAVNVLMYIQFHFRLPHIFCGSRTVKVCIQHVPLYRTWQINSCKRSSKKKAKEGQIEGNRQGTPSHRVLNNEVKILMHKYCKTNRKAKEGWVQKNESPKNEPESGGITIVIIIIIIIIISSHFFHQPRIIVNQIHAS